MDQTTRYRLARVSYCSLFVLTPAIAAFFALGASGSSAGASVAVLVILAVVGEHGFRPWKRLWGVGIRPSDEKDPS